MYRHWCKRGSSGLLLLVGLVGLLLTLYLLFQWKLRLGPPRSDRDDQFYDTLTLSDTDVNRLPWWKEKCYFHNCFEINDCRYSKHNIVKVFVYPDYQYYSPNWPHPLLINTSLEYQEIIETIRSSRYYEPRPLEACVYVTPIDTLNQRTINITLISQLLSSLPWWNNGTNHVIFSMLPGQPSHYNSTPDFYYDKAVLANAMFAVQDYRMGFDISLPVFNSLTRKKNFSRYHNNQNRRYILTVLIQSGADPVIVNMLKSVYQSSDERVILLGSCDQCECAIEKRCDVMRENKHWSYPDLLQDSKYCLIVPGRRMSSPDLLDILMMGCVPVIISNYQLVLPFSEVLDWVRGSVMIWREDLSQILLTLNKIGEEELNAKQKQVLYFYSHYFHSIPAVTMTTLDILNGRVFPFDAPPYEHWNGPDHLDHWNARQSCLKLPSSAPEEGFTAVILAYDRIKMLFETIQSVAQVSSLAKVVVVWNNSYKAPPPSSEWPQINKPVQVIQTKKNKLSNRFYPYPEIQTAAVLSLDDDITMMSPDEIEFGFKAWLEYPNRLVGFPGRVHWYDSKAGGWKYDSDWTNNVSVVLTGAAFYHKYYHYHYTYLLPKQVSEWVDKHFNCEDIVFNFMISNVTGLPPLKVTPRKRFKCANCASDGLYADSAHFLERNQCIDLFTKYFGGMPLKTVKYRLDPVLYKVKSDVSKAFPKIGEL